jgi:hypothetical protein
MKELEGLRSLEELEELRSLEELEELKEPGEMGLSTPSLSSSSVQI